MLNYNLKTKYIMFIINNYILLIIILIVFNQSPVLLDVILTLAKFNFNHFVMCLSK